METFDKVKEIIVNSLGCDASEVTSEACISEDLGADSLDAVEIIMDLEDAFGISVPEEKAKEIKTVQDVVALVDSLR